MALYHCDRSDFILSAIKLFGDWRVRVGLGCGVVDRCTCHIPAAHLRVPYMITYPFFSTIISAELNVAVHLSSHSWPRYIIAPDWRWWKIRVDLSLVYNKDVQFISELWVACMRLTYGRITLGPWCVLTFFTQWVSTLMYFFVAPVSEIIYLGLYVGEFPLQLLHSLVFCINGSSTLVLTLLI